jgi:tetratricopeptide (TPR) repeat protein
VAGQDGGDERMTVVQRLQAHSDPWGSCVFANRASAVTTFNVAVDKLVSLSGDPVALADEAAAADPGFPLARVLQAYLALYSTAAEGFERARSLLGDLDPWSLGAGERELLHTLAAQSWANGEWERAASFLERALLHDPHDLLALKVAQDLYFFTGQQPELQQVVERVLRAWPARHTGSGFVAGMHAFGLEENGHLGAAEERARLALRENPTDVWAVHALAHVFEMGGFPRQGIEFLQQCTESWSSSYFAVHLWWHLALWHLDLLEFDEALALYDGSLRGTRSIQWLDMVDAASLLWRLHLFGIDVRDRARALADDAAPALAAPVYVFNDWHAVMAAGVADDRDFCEHLILLNRDVTSGTNRRVVEGAGLDLLEGFAAFADNDTSRAFNRLVDIGPRAHVVGGSNAQRDVIEQTLIATAASSGNLSVAESLLVERAARRPSARDAGLELIRVNMRR